MKLKKQGEISWCAYRTEDEKAGDLIVYRSTLLRRFFLVAAD